MATRELFRRYAVTNFYHFTDRRNLTLIRELGGLFSLARLMERGIEIPAPGGNDWSHNADKNKGLDMYVHLCFKNNHPMEYIAHQDGRIEDSIFLRIHPEVLEFEGVMFTPDVLNKSGVRIHPIEDADEMIDFASKFSTPGPIGKTRRSRSACSERKSARFLCQMKYLWS